MLRDGSNEGRPLAVEANEAGPLAHNMFILLLYDVYKIVVAFIMVKSDSSNYV